MLCMKNAQLKCTVVSRMFRPTSNILKKKA